MNHLQEAVRTHFSALTSLKQQAAQYRQEKEGTIDPPWLDPDWQQRYKYYHPLLSIFKYGW